MPLLCRRSVFVGLIAFLLVSSIGGSLAQTDPLPSWNDGVVKKSTTDFVQRVTTAGGPDFAPLEQRIATFDNDGTLWCEQPFYFQLAFAFDRVKALAPQHPEWKTKQPFKAILEGDMKALAAAGEKGLLQIVAAMHAGMTTDEFSAAMPGSMPATSQLDWLISMTAMIVLFWSRATRDLLKSFGWGIAGTPSIRCSDEVAIPRRPPHSVSRSPVPSDFDRN